MELAVGIVGELRTPITELRAAVVAAAVHGHHGPDRGPFPPDAR